MKKTAAFAIAAVLALSGCAAATGGETYWQATNLPKTKSIEVVPTDELATWCPKYPNAQACARQDFYRGTCTIYVQTVFKDDAALLEHERCHCAGYEHEIPTLGYGNLNFFQVPSHLEVVGTGPSCPDRR